MPDTITIPSILGNIELTPQWEKDWDVTVKRREYHSGIEGIVLHFSTGRELPPPRFSLGWKIPQMDIQCRWYPAAHFNKNVPPDWGAAVSSNLAFSAPLLAFFNQQEENRLTFSCSEAQRQIEMIAGVREETNEIFCEILFFTQPEAPLDSYEVELRLDISRRFYAEVLRDATAWFAALPGYDPAIPPETAYEPFYSSWYSYHQNLCACELEEQCRLAKEYGFKGIIIDDGWQTDDNNRGYAFCGDWQLSARRFPDMKAHVARIHELGLKYMIWYSVPFVGHRSRAYELFQEKYLYDDLSLEAAVLDPRFPEVREYLIGIYEAAIRNWAVDGFKLDFIDSFQFRGPDKAVTENDTGRDIRSLPEAVDLLLTEVMHRLRAIKPDILIEFRQNYIGPAIRKYGNIFRAADSPADILANRIRTLDLRLFSGNTAVHSDMIEWNENEKPEIAALQLLNVLFSVPQISVRLERLPESHREMLHFWLDFCVKHRSILLHGTLYPHRPDLNYPVVEAKQGMEKVIAIYDCGQVVKISGKAGELCYLVNATGGRELYLDVEADAVKSEMFNACGHIASAPTICHGIYRYGIEISGLLKLTF